jgi:hypothetical protein
MTSPWWAAFGPAETRISCGGGRHRLRWAEGALEAADHGDAEGELVIAALGGGTTPCLDLVRVWGRHCDDLSVLAIAPRSGDDELTIGPEAIEELVPAGTDPAEVIRSARARQAARATAAGIASSHGVTPAASAGVVGRVAGPAAHTSVARYRFTRSMRPVAGAHVRPMAQFFAERAEVPALMALGLPFQLRLSAAVAHAWSADGARASELARADPALTAALAGRLAPAAEQWLGVDPDEVEAGIHDGTGWGEIELTRSAGQQRLHATLPVSWLARVWAPGLSVVSRHLVVRVLHAAWPVAQVLALERPGASPVELGVRHADGCWSVTA